MSLFKGETPSLGQGTTVVDQASGSPLLLAPKRIVEFNSLVLPNPAGSDFFVADQPYQVLGVKVSYGHVGGSGALAAVRKITDTSAPTAAASATVVEFIGTGVDLTATANTVYAGTLSTTASDLKIAKGNRIAVNFPGTLTALTNIYVQLELAPLSA